MISESLDELKKRVPILEVASSLGINVVKNRARCLKPQNHSHGDRTPSMSFNIAKNSFRCWVCPDVHGSVIDLVMIARDIGFSEALSFLRAGYPIEKNSMCQVVNTFSESRLQKNAGERVVKKGLSKEKQIEILNRFIDMCQQSSREGSQYLRKRGISQKVEKAMKLAHITDYAHVNETLIREFGKQSLVDSGLYNDSGNLRFYKHRLLFPYYHNGNVVYVQGRAVDGLIMPKELNMASTVPCPYNIDALSAYSVVYLCEGVVDTLTLLSAGFPAVGIPGVSAFKKEWLSQFRGKTVYSVLDSDAAGKRANDSLALFFKEAGISFKVHPIPDGYDINDFFSGKTWKKSK